MSSVTGLIRKPRRFSRPVVSESGHGFGTTEFELCSIDSAHDGELQYVLHTVMMEFGVAGRGFSKNDPEVSNMSATYRKRGHFYAVLTRRGRVVGGGGIVPLKGASPEICEFRKMYFLPEARGRGLGRKLLERCLETARQMGYKTCYLETLSSLDAARRLYMKAGFEKLDAPLGDTGHYACDMWLKLELK